MIGSARLFGRQVGVRDQFGRRQENEHIGIVKIALDAVGQHVGDGLAMARQAAAATLDPSKRRLHRCGRREVGRLPTGSFEIGFARAKRPGMAG